jgi:hypothetical protein
VPHHSGFDLAHGHLHLPAPGSYPGGGVLGGDTADDLLCRAGLSPIEPSAISGCSAAASDQVLGPFTTTATKGSVRPELIPELPARVAVCLEATGDLQAVIDAAKLARDANGFVRLVLEAMQPVWARGRVVLVERWMERSLIAGPLTPPR